MNPLWLIWLELTDPQGELVCVGVALLLAMLGSFSLSHAVPRWRHDLPFTRARIRAGEAPAGAWWRDAGPLACHALLGMAVVGLWWWAPWPTAWAKASHFGLFGFLLAHGLLAWGLGGAPGPWWGRLAYHKRHGLAWPESVPLAPPKSRARAWAKKRKGKGKKRRR